MEDQTIGRHTAPTMQRSLLSKSDRQMDEGMHPPLPKKGDLGFTMPYYGTAKNPKLTTFLGKTKMASEE